MERGGGENASCSAPCARSCRLLPLGLCKVATDLSPRPFSTISYPPLAARAPTRTEPSLGRFLVLKSLSYSLSFLSPIHPLLAPLLCLPLPSEPLLPLHFNLSSSLLIRPSLALDFRVLTRLVPFTLFADLLLPRIPPLSPIKMANELSRKDSELSAMEQEKGIAYHQEVMAAIGEEDSGGNVGTAAYERSKFMADIVSRPFASILVLKPHLLRVSALRRNSELTRVSSLPPSLLFHRSLLLHRRPDP